MGKLSVARFAENSGLSDTAVRNYLSGESSPRLESLIAMAQVAEVSVGWLADGEGPMVPTRVREQQVGYEPDDPDLIRVPIFEGPLGAGSPGEPSSGIMGYGGFFRRWLREEANIQPELAFVAPVYGNSMTRLFFDGDLVLGERVEGFESDGTYAVVWEGDLYVKHVRRTRRAILLISENASFPPIVIPKAEYEQFRVLGRVVRRITGLY